MLNELKLFYLLGKSTLSKADKQLADVESTVACMSCMKPRGAGATGQREQLPPLPKHCGGSTGATGCPFCQNCTSKFVHYSQKLEFRT
jgi:hypothetical protein